MLKLYDTCALIHYQNEIFEEKEHFYVSNITLNELENIKSSGTKDEETKYNARSLLHKLAENQDLYDIVLFKNSYLDAICEADLPATPDTKIIACAYHFCKNPNLEFPADSRFFVTDDLACQAIAKSIGVPILYKPYDSDEEYCGYKEIEMTEDQLADFYNNEIMNPDNKFELLTNQYLLIKQNDKIIDKYRWAGDHYEKVNFIKFESSMFGKIVPKDDYQNIAMDSLVHNQLTVIRGKAGSGKSLIGLAYLFQELEKHKIDKIVMFVNPVATKDSCKFGFLPGTFLEKVLGSQIGVFLASKLGGIEYVYQLIEEHQLEFVALSDARGYDTTGLHCGLYMTESQNTSVELMKLILSRIGEDTPCILEGDNDMQTDMLSYAGRNNGLRRVCEVYKGEDYFGCTTLQNCYRSRIAAKIELL